MRDTDDIIRRLTEPPSPELLQRVARQLYEIEPLRHPRQVRQRRGRRRLGQSLAERRRPEAVRPLRRHDHRVVAGGGSGTGRWLNRTRTISMAKVIVVDYDRSWPVTFERLREGT
jgi:hypothetical protein